MLCNIMTVNWVFCIHIQSGYINSCMKTPDQNISLIYIDNYMMYVNLNCLSIQIVYTYCFI